MTCDNPLKWFLPSTPCEPRRVTHRTPMLFGGGRHLWVLTHERSFHTRSLYHLMCLPPTSQFWETDYSHSLLIQPLETSWWVVLLFSVSFRWVLSWYKSLYVGILIFSWHVLLIRLRFSDLHHYYIWVWVMWSIRVYHIHSKNYNPFYWHHREFIFESPLQRYSAELIRHRRY